MYKFASRDLQVTVPNGRYDVFKSKNKTPSGNQLGAARQPVKLNAIMKTYEAEVKIT